MLQEGEFVNKVKVLYSIGLHRVRDHSIFVLKVSMYLNKYLIGFYTLLKFAF